MSKIIFCYSPNQNNYKKANQFIVLLMNNKMHSYTTLALLRGKIRNWEGEKTSLESMKRQFIIQPIRTHICNLVELLHL